MAKYDNGYVTNLFDKNFSLSENRVIGEYMDMWKEERPRDYAYVIIYQADPNGESYYPESTRGITLLQALSYISTYKSVRPDGYRDILSKLPSDVSDRVEYMINAYKVNYSRIHNKAYRLDGKLKQDFTVAKNLQRKNVKSKSKTVRKPAKKVVKKKVVNKCGCK